MKELEKIISEEDVTKVADKILQHSFEKIVEMLNCSFYDEMRSYLYEHYTNFSSDVRNKLIEEISDQYIQSQNDYKFKPFRDKIFEENKELVLNSITEDIITNNLNNILYNWTTDNFYKDKTKRALVKFIIKNSIKLDLDNLIIDNLEQEVRNLKAENKELKEVIDRCDKDEDDDYHM